MTHTSNRLIKITLICLLLAIGVHTYLAYHHYQMAFGSAEPSFCNINATFDCDAVNASGFSEFLGFPLALWAALTNAALFIVLLGVLMLDYEPSERWHRMAIWLSGGIALGSVVMATISSLLLGTYCLFCIAAYILSFATLGLTWASYRKSFLSHFSSDFLTLFTRQRGLLGVFIMIPVGVFLFNDMAVRNFTGGNFKKIVESSLREWRAEKVHEFNVEDPVLSLGADREHAKVTLVEYADFRCPHCKDASPKLHAFTRAHPDVRLVFMTFPLDGECNPDMQHRNGLSCRLAKASHCAIQFGKGWEMHDRIFEHQLQYRTMDDVNRILEEETKSLGLEWSQLSACMESSETQDRIAARAKLAANAGIQGTPTVYVNGRQLNGAQFLPILRAVYAEAVKSID